MIDGWPTLINLGGIDYVFFDGTLRVEKELDNRVRELLQKLGVPNPPKRLLGHPLLAVEPTSESSIRESYRVFGLNPSAWIQERAEFWRLAAPLDLSSETETAKKAKEKKGEGTRAITKLDLTAASLVQPNGRVATLPEILALEIYYSEILELGSRIDTIEMTSTTISDLAAWGCPWAMEMVADSYYHCYQCVVCIEPRKKKKPNLKIVFDKPVFTVHYGVPGTWTNFRVAIDQFHAD